MSQAPDNLSYLCSVNGVSVQVFEHNQLTLFTDGQIVAYITSQPIPQQAVILQVWDNFSHQTATIVLLSSTKAWLQEEKILVFPREEGGLWRLDCRASDQAAFTALQDVLTYFIKYENRHHMRNTLAMISPSCQVTQVVANNVHLDANDQNAGTREDPVAAEEEKMGQKLPVTVDRFDIPGDHDPAKIEKVRLLRQSGSAIVTGSGWLANALVFAGNTLAKGIQSGSEMIEKRVEPTQTPMRLSEGERQVLDSIANTTNMVCKTGVSLMDKAVSATVSGISTLCENSEQQRTRDPVAHAGRSFGISALKAAANVLGGVATAASVVIGSSRDGIVHIVHRKYGEDAGYVAQRTMGSAADIADTLVYFDAGGIARRVLTSSAHAISAYQAKKNLQREIVFDAEDHHQSYQDASYSSSSSSSKPGQSLV
ncbi:senescence-associated protein-domain-containing protein [Phycomyces nitens]|nr:senescence-associated protein-domain-containing protein [Phycomyces nitens]